MNIGVVGKYIELQDAYKSVYESLAHAGIANHCRVNIIRVDAEDLENKSGLAALKKLDGILVPGGFGDRGIEGKISAAKFARENKIPYCCLLYTSDAADDSLRVDLGGRRIIKKFTGDVV